MKPGAEPTGEGPGFDDLPNEPKDAGYPGRHLEQGDSRNVSRPVARILMEANIGQLPTKFGYNQMHGWKVVNRYRILQVNFHILTHLTFDLFM